MTDPIRCSVPRTPESVDALLHEATGARDDVRLDSSRPVVDGRGLTSDAVDHALHLIEGATHLTEAVAERTARSAATVRGAQVASETALRARIISMPLSAAVLGYTLADGASGDFRRGRQENEQYHYDMMRGALAVFETRSADPAVVAERESNPAFRDGCDRAERVIHQDAALTERIIRAVRGTETEGYAAVVDGRDHGATFERRYRDDLCFRHAVDHARAHEGSGDARWDEIRARVAAACVDATAARASTPIRI